MIAYSSWPIDDLGGERHPVHLGVAKEATDRRIVLDDFVRERGIERLHLIKIDTDGHELDVLRGATETIRRFLPMVIFELTAYLLHERGYEYSDYENFLRPLGYRLYEAKCFREMHVGDLEGFIPKGGGIDVVAVPPTR